jgi:hypothetical protein
MILCTSVELIEVKKVKLYQTMQMDDNLSIDANIKSRYNEEYI